MLEQGENTAAGITDAPEAITDDRRSPADGNLGHRGGSVAGRSAVTIGMETGGEPVLAVGRCGMIRSSIGRIGSVSSPPRLDCGRMVTSVLRTYNIVC